MYYVYQPGYYYYPDYMFDRPYDQSIRQQFPPINPNLLYQSANETRRLMKDANMVLDKLSNSKEFNTELMYAAQSSNKKEVNRLINSLGLASDVTIDFNPDGLHLEFKSQVESKECCHLKIALRWR
ncbi:MULTISPECIES: hypothetical protein [Paraliobacillus]|uniref:hypothetical protein n=1 Tax=Paraliobacillus TaxID=200903 RepID=UPI000DD48AC4|nr:MULTISPECIES: hypothetical protein [Paraliobacillus]